MKSFHFILILFFGFISAQKVEFSTLKNVEMIENQYYSKSLILSDTENARTTQAHLLRLFNISDEVSSANIIELKITSPTTLQLIYSDDQKKNFEFKTHKKYIEIIFNNENVGVPLIYQRSNIDKLRLGVTKDNNLLVQKYVGKSGSILVFGDGYSSMSNFVFTNYTNYKDLKPFTRDGKWGVELNGKVITDANYEVTSVFKLNYIRVQKDNKWGLLNNEGREIIPIIYDDIFDLDKQQVEIFYVKKSNKIGLVNSKGEEIVPPIYDRISRFNDDYFEIVKDEKYGLATTEKIIFPALYTYLGWFSRGKVWERYLDKENKYITAKRDGKDVILDSQGYEYDSNRKIPTFDLGQVIVPLKETGKKVLEN